MVGRTRSFPGFLFPGRCYRRRDSRDTESCPAVAQRNAGVHVRKEIERYEHCQDIVGVAAVVKDFAASAAASTEVMTGYVGYRVDAKAIGLEAIFFPVGKNRSFRGRHLQAYIDRAIVIDDGLSRYGIAGDNHTFTHLRRLLVDDVIWAGVSGSSERSEKRAANHAPAPP